MMVAKSGGALASPCHLCLAAPVGSRALSELACHHHMPVVFDCVVCAPWEEPGDHRPLVAVESVCCKQLLLLLFCERPPIDAGVELVEPP